MDENKLAADFSAMPTMAAEKLADGTWVLPDNFTAALKEVALNQGFRNPVFHVEEIDGMVRVTFSEAH